MKRKQTKYFYYKNTFDEYVGPIPFFVVPKLKIYYLRKKLNQKNKNTFLDHVPLRSIYQFLDVNQKLLKK
jgi:hypothetical protein